MKERILTPGAQDDRDNFERYAREYGGCSCHLNPPCGHCAHPGNPLNQEDESCWQEVGPELVEVSTADLIGKALDHAVAIAEGMYIHTPPGLKFEYWYKDGRCVTSRFAWSPSTSWGDAGPLIEKESVTVGKRVDCRPGAKQWDAFIDVKFCPAAIGAWFGETPLIAACRAIVSAKLGDTVQVPKELLP